MMMGMSGFTQTFFIAICKDNSEYHAELVDFDPIEASFIESRVERILQGRAQRIARDPADWRCKGCFKRGVCWEGVAADRACQTCQFASPTPSGGWFCTRHGKDAALPCDDWTQYEPKPRTA
jgi:hypothetical protein